MQTTMRDAAEAAELLAERILTDPIRNSADYGTQGDFQESDKPECWLFGANRSGKTHSLAKKVACLARFGHHRPSDAMSKLPGPPMSIMVVSRNADQSRNVFQPKLFHNRIGVNETPFIPDSEIESWNQTTQILFLKNGSKIIFKVSESGSEAFAGYDVDLMAFDEPPFEEVYKECTFRVGGNRRLLIRGAATVLPPPGQPGGISWMYRRKIAPWMENGKNAGSKSLDIFTMALKDNPFILDEERTRLEEMYLPGTPEHQIRIEGKLLASIGGSPVYTGFMRDYHINPLLDKTQIVPFVPLVLAVDFNTENGVWLVGQKIGQTFKVYDEICLERSDVMSMTMEFRIRYPSHGAELWIYGDSTGRKRSEQTGESNYFMIAEYLQGYPCPIRYFIPPKNPPVEHRVNSVNRIFRPADGMRRFEMSGSCEETIADFEGSKWKQNGTIDKEGGRRSDGADSLGYWIMQSAPVAMPLGRQHQNIRTIRSPGRARPVSGRPFPATVRSIRMGRR